jgi:flagellar motor switch protein FliM
MKELLSKAEIDSLLSHFKNEGPAEDTFFDDRSGPERAAKARISSADLLKPNRVPREQMQAVHDLFKHAAARIAGSLSEKLRTFVPCDCIAVEQVRFTTWVAAHVDPVLAVVIDARPPGTTCLLSVTASMVHAMVDRTLGGSGDGEGSGSEFSEAEIALGETCLEPVLQRCSDALTALLPTKLGVRACLAGFEFARVIPDQELVLAVHMQVTGKSIMGDVRFVFPHAPFAEYLPKAAAGKSIQVVHPPGTRARVERLMGDVRTEMSVELGGADMTVGELIGLRPGDIIRLDRRFGQPVVAPVQGKPKFRGQIGKMGSHLAFRVGEVLAHAE